MIDFFMTKKSLSLDSLLKLRDTIENKFGFSVEFIFNFPIYV